MNFLIINNPAQLPWQTIVYDSLVFVLFVSAVINAVIEFRRGVRMYAFVLVAALFYGVVLELAGMATLNMYQQGDFLVMLNFPVLPLFEGTTAMPLYVTLFYPVIFSVGFKVIEALGIATRWKAAVAGGMFMILLDAPYIIEGNLRHVVWWTWRADFSLFQYWLGWPLVDMAWQAVWGMVFYYLMLGARSRVDGAVGERWTAGRAFGVEAPVRAVSVLVIGTLLLSPLTIWTFLVGRQWPFMVVLVTVFAVITISALRSATPPSGRPDGLLSAWIALYVVAFGAMIIANVMRDGTVSLYVVVQALGLVGVVAMATFQLWARRVPAPETTHEDVVSDALP
ncbi:hypothetical protein A5649_08955 [Mycolicibacter heraklionensis]|uniref:Carotenoid biosynthesis protein n=1 Tax=Mycolicibacter heraklionensis TaxID=512402 RepID=A0AA91EYX1_9MYCO|nr:hypothetical protein [Mycolicibacter heraklionensis]OBK82454.1 hypothetical protein A5649_08955 [Mycolicibacter heraklionensis]